MSFLTVPVIDNFNRANGAIGANWTVFNGKPEVNANQLCVGTTNESEFYWNTLFGPNQEAYITLAAGLSTAQEYRLLVRRNTTLFPTAYEARVLIEEEGEELVLFRSTTGVGVTVLGRLAVKWEPGDLVGIQAIGTVIRAFRQAKGTGPITEVIEAEDSDISGSGRCGVLIGSSQTASRLDNFGAGTLPFVSVTKPQTQQTLIDTSVSLPIEAVNANSYTATGLPVGLSIDSSSGIISGIPTTAGTAPVTITVTGPLGDEASTTFTWTVFVHPLPGKGPPSLREEFPLHLTIASEDFTFLINESFTFSNVDPGGFEMASFTVSKDLPQVMRGQHVSLSSGLQIAWEGRVKEVQRSLGGKTLIQCEGYGAVLKEHSLAEIFVDRDMTRWQNLSLQRQIQLVTDKQAPSSTSLGFSSVGAVALVAEFTAPWEANALPRVEGWYDTHGIPIGRIHYAWEKGANVDAANIHWLWAVNIYEQEVEGVFEGSGNLRAVGPGSGYFETVSNKRLYAAIVHGYDSSEGGTGSKTPYAIYFSQMAVYGLGFHEWVNAGNEVDRGTDPVGYYPSGIAVYAIDQCPGVQRGVYEAASQIIVPHASYLTPVPIEQIISDMAKFAGWHWGVWESLGGLTGSKEPRVDFRSYPTAATAYAWRHECQSVDVRENIDNLYDSARVTYTEPGGVERAVEVSRANPVLERAGLHRQVVLNFGTGVKEAAEVWGLIQLALLSDQARATGSATINQAVHKMDGSRMAPWMLRAGLDRLRINDLPSVDVWGADSDMPITRVECSGSEQGLVTSVELGNGVNLIETLAAQLQAKLTAGGA